MCGIAGIVGSVPPDSISKMVTAMHHRGPDDSGVFTEDGIALGMARLAIIDISRKGHQPMSNPNGSIWIVYNGEAYNFREERDILIKKGYQFNSGTDTEVVLRMYEAYGDDFLLRIRGIFGLAIYDKRRGKGRERLLLARDPLGVKPLLYVETASGFVFGSEMKAILSSGLVEKRFDPEALRMLISYGSIAQPLTAVKGVRMLMPGHRMIIESGKERTERYWSLGRDRIGGLRGKTCEDQVDYIRSALEETVRLQMVGDVPIGAFLSGGVDSSLLVALFSSMSNSKAMTFSVGFEQEGVDIDESDDAERIAEFIGTKHSKVIVTGQDVRDRINHIAYSLDQPSVDGVNSYFVSMAAGESVTVAISGTGGDELFAGYPWFINMAASHTGMQRKTPVSWIKKLASGMARSDVFNCCASGRFGKRLERMRSNGDFLAQYARQYQLFGAKGAEKILSPDIKQFAHMGRDPSRDIVSADELVSDSSIERVTALCLRGYTQDQLLRDIDSVSMAHSLEVRVPFLDHVFVDAALSLPDRTKLGDVSTIKNAVDANYRETGAKKILIDIGHDMLPEGMDLQKKRGFGMPFDAWLNGPLKDVMDDTLSEKTVIDRGLFNVKEVGSVRERFYTGNSTWVFPWLLMITELWCREVLDNNSKNN